MNKQNLVYDYNGVLVTLKRESVQLPATTWVNLGDMLSEVSQSQKEKIWYDSFYMRSLEQAIF